VFPRPVSRERRERGWMPGIKTLRSVCGSVRFFSSSPRSCAQETTSKHVLRDYNITTTFRYSLLHELPPQVQAYPWATPTSLRRVRTPPRRVKMITREYGLPTSCSSPLTNAVSFMTVSIIQTMATSPNKPEYLARPSHFNSRKSRTVLHSIDLSPTPSTSLKIRWDRNGTHRPRGRFSTPRPSYSNPITARRWLDISFTSTAYTTIPMPIYAYTK